MTPDSYMMRFEDGPLATRSNVSTLESVFSGAPSAPGTMTIARSVFGWPLPDRLGVLAIGGAEYVGFWDADDPAEAELPSEITDSPRAVVYAKVSESRITDEQAIKLTHVMRGALYRLEHER